MLVVGSKAGRKNCYYPIGGVLVYARVGLEVMWGLIR